MIIERTAFGYVQEPENSIFKNCVILGTNLLTIWISETSNRNEPKWLYVNSGVWVCKGTSPHEIKQKVQTRTKFLRIKSVNA